MCAADLNFRKPCAAPKQATDPASASREPAIGECRYVVPHPGCEKCAERREVVSTKAITKFAEVSPILTTENVKLSDLRFDVASFSPYICI